MPFFSLAVRVVGNAVESVQVCSQKLEVERPRVLRLSQSNSSVRGAASSNSHVLFNLGIGHNPCYRD